MRTLLLLTLAVGMSTAAAVTQDIEVLLDGKHYKGTVTDVSLPTPTPTPSATPAPTPAPVISKNMDRFKGDWAYVKNMTGSEWSFAMNNGNVRGVAVRAMWNRDNLEPTEGHYNFAGMDAYVSAAKAKGKAVAFLFLFQDYWGLDCVPAWFRAQAQEKVGNRCEPAVWRPAVADKMAKLILAFHDHYQNDPMVGGVIGGETSYPKMGTDYSTAGVENGVAAISDAVGPRFKDSRLHFFLESNWSNRTDMQVTKIVGYGGGLSHPDLTVSNKRLGNTPGGYDLNPSWGLGCFAPIARLPSMGSATCAKTYKGTGVPLAISFQEGGRRSVLAGYTPKEIRDYAFKDLGVSWVFWDEPYSTGKTLQADFLPVINREPYPY